MNVEAIIEEENIGQENEEDLFLDIDSYSDAVLWSTDWTTETIVSQLNKGNIDLSPAFQRREAWGDVRKSKFIESLFLGLPIPQIILAENKKPKGKYIVIDGKQRLLSLRQFTAKENDEFKILKLTGLEYNILNGKSYDDFKEDLECTSYINEFDNNSIRTVIIKNWPSEEFLYKVFLRLNTGSLQLSAQELRQALYPGRFTSYLDSFSIENRFIRQALRISAPDRRMRDTEIVLRYFAYKNFFENYNSNLKEFLDNTCKNLNKRWEIDESLINSQSEDFNNAMETTFEIFGTDAFHKYTKSGFTKIFNRPLFDIMTYYFSFSEIRESAKLHKDEVFNKFKEISLDNEFNKSIETSTKNIDPVVIRFSMWGKILKNILNIKIEIPQRIDNKIEFF